MTRLDVRKAIIPAAGLGTRFLPATKASPKEMLPLVDKPLIQYVVEEAVAAGIEDIIVITGRGKRAIEDHFDRSLELEENLKGSGKAQVLNQIRHISNLANFCYVRQSEALGLGHAVLCAQHLIGNEPFAVILGDEIIDAPVPALAQLKLVTRLELRGRGDVQLYRVQMPGPVIAKDPAGDAKVTISIARSHFNELAAEGKVKHWRDAFESGVARASGPPEILRLIVNVVERQEERSRTRHAKRR